MTAAIRTPEFLAVTETRTPAGEPWGRRLWFALLLVAVVSFALESHGIATWPMADDEVPSLVEMHLIHEDANAFSVPASQIGRLPRAVPVWYTLQHLAIDLLPKSEVSYRLPTLACGIAASLLIFLFAARWRGLWFASALTILLLGSQLFLEIAQIDRFYCLAFLLLTITAICICTPGSDLVFGPLTAGLTILTMLSHNMTLAVFGIACVAAWPLGLLGRLPRHVLVRSSIALVTGLLLYVIYLRPLVTGWASTGNPTPVLISFAAYAAMPVLGLGMLGACLALLRREASGAMIWALLIFTASLALFLVATVSWNPRYFLFFLPALWLLAAHAMEWVARHAGDRRIAVAWYAVVVVLLTPSVLSHFQDGSRHDYRQAAHVLESAARPGDPILSDDAETISYYLPEELERGLEVRTKVTTYPASEFFLVCRANVWMTLPQVPHRQMELLAEIEHRRFDEFSHVLRVYRVAAESGR